MKNIKRVLILFIAIMLLSSCGWDDVKDIPSFECVYKGSLPLGDGKTLTTMAVYKTDSELGIKYNGTPMKLMDSAGNKQSSHNGVSKTSFSYSDLADLSETYKKTSTCPPNVYYKKGVGSSYSFKTSCSGNGCYAFSRNEKESTTDLSDVDNKKYSWTCNYTIDGVKVKYEVTNLEATYIKNPQLLSNSTPTQNFAFKYYLNGQEQVGTGTGTIKNYDGKQGNKNMRNIVSAVQFLRKSINNNKVSCPTIYKQLYDGTGTLVNELILTTSAQECTDQVTGCIDTSLIKPNQPANPTSMTCKDETTGKTDSTCDTYISQETLHDDQILECDYSVNSNLGGASDKFKISYDKNKNTIKFNALGTNLSHKFINESDIINEFKKTASSNRCPTYIACSVVSKKVYIATMDLTTFTDDSGKSRDFKGRCGSIDKEQGQTVTDPSSHESQLVLDGSTLDFSDSKMSCKNLLGNNLYKVLHMFISAVRIAAAIIAIILIMLALIPAITSDDAGALKKATTKSIYILVVLIIIELLPTLIGVIGKIAGFDLTCL